MADHPFDKPSPPFAVPPLAAPPPEPKNPFEAAALAPSEARAPALALSLPAASAPSEPRSPFESARVGAGSPTKSSLRPADELWHDQLAKLEEWAQENRKGARNDTLAFWALKVPAIIASASAGIWAHFELTTVGIIAGSVASLCVIIDGINPRGTLRNIHLRAFFDLRILMDRMTTRLISSSGQPEDVVRTIIRESETERKRIAAYIRDAEGRYKRSDKG